VELFFAKRTTPMFRPPELAAWNPSEAADLPGCHNGCREQGEKDAQKMT